MPPTNLNFVLILTIEYIPAKVGIFLFLCYKKNNNNTSGLSCTSGYLLHPYRSENGKFLLEFWKNSFGNFLHRLVFEPTSFGFTVKGVHVQTLDHGRFHITGFFGVSNMHKRHFLRHCCKQLEVKYNIVIPRYNSHDLCCFLSK